MLSFEGSVAIHLTRTQLIVASIVSAHIQLLLFISPEIGKNFWIKLGKLQFSYTEKSNSFSPNICFLKFLTTHQMWIIFKIFRKSVKLIEDLAIKPKQAAVTPVVLFQTNSFTHHLIRKSRYIFFLKWSSEMVLFSFKTISAS